MRTTKKCFITLFGIIMLLSVMGMNLHAGFSAYGYIDYYYMIKSNVQSQEKLNGFWLRQLDLTYESDISDKIKARGRLEMYNDGKFGSSELSITPFVKDAYVSYQFHPLHSLTLGIQEGLNFSGIEKFYGYRHIEKTPFDLYKVRSSREFGLSLKGSFDKDKKLNYGIMFGNFSSYKDEIDKYKEVSARFTYNPTAHLMFEVNGDMVKRSAAKKSYLIQGFAGYQGSWGRVGVNYGNELTTETGKDDVNMGVASVFAVGKLSKAIEVLVRYDVTSDPHLYGNDRFLIINKGYKTNLFIAGLGWNIHPKVQLMPNIKWVNYKENSKGVKPEDFTQFIITAYFQF